MKNLFLMSLFGLFMTVAFAGQSVSGLSLVAAAYAGDDHESNDTASNRQDDNEQESQGLSENAHNSSSDDEASNSSDDASNSVAFSCPEGVTACYRADGSEYIDVNNLTATAAGIESDDEHENDDEEHESDDDVSVSPVSTTTYANPRHYRSF